MSEQKSDIELIAAGGYVTLKIHNPIHFEGGHAGIVMKWPEALKIHWALMEAILGSVEEKDREHVATHLARMPKAIKMALKSRRHDLN